MSEKTEPELRSSALAWDEAKAKSSSFGFEKRHRDLESHENEFDAEYQEWQYQEAAKKLEEYINKKENSRNFEKVEIDEPGCEKMTGYKIGEPKFVINAHLHGDEPGPAIPMFIQLVDRIIDGDSRINNVLIIPRCNPEAYKNLDRGVGLDEELWTRLVEAKVFTEEDKVNIVADGNIEEKKFVELLESKNFYISGKEDEDYYIDLNRQFSESEDFQQPDIKTLFPKARQLLRMIKEYAPNAKEGFSFHADNSTITTQIIDGEEVEVTGGNYLYDTPKLFPENLLDQENEQFLRTCITNFQTQMETAGLPLFTGIDDVSDKLLGQNKVDRGLSVVPANEKRVDVKIVPRPAALHDKSFETAMVRWGMDRYWALETAGWNNIDKRAEMIKILLDTIVLPIMGKFNLPPEPVAVILPSPEEQLKVA